MVEDISFQHFLKNKKNFLVIFLITFQVIFSAFPGGFQTALAAAGSPQIISHQGRLLDASGNLLGGAGNKRSCNIEQFGRTTHAPECSTPQRHRCRPGSNQTAGFLYGDANAV